MRSSLGTPSRPLSRVALCALAWTAVATIAAAPIVVATIAVATIAVGAGEPAASSGSSPGSMARGAYLFRIAGCDSCHTDHRQGGPVGAGGPALETRFGLFYGPNLTPDLEHGIGRWHEADFVRAMRSGRAPDGHTYAPVFPYTSFTRLTDDDLIALYTYLRALPPAPVPNRPPQGRGLLALEPVRAAWRAMNLHPGPQGPDPARSDLWNRGAYLVGAVAHCGECHTPRGPLGNLKKARAMAGTRSGADGRPVPNITPDRATGIGDWSRDARIDLLRTGLLPDGDVTGGLMGEVVEYGTRFLTDEDLEAMVVYLESLPAVASRSARRDRTPPESKEESW